MLLLHLYYFTNRFEESILNLINLTTFLITHILSIIALISAVALVFANLVRYAVSRRFGIPFRFTFTNIQEVIDAFSVAFILLGIGVMLPLFLLSMDIESEVYISVVFFAIAISTGFAVMMFNLLKDTDVYKKTLKNISVLMLIFGFLSFLAFSIFQILSTEQTNNIGLHYSFLWNCHVYNNSGICE